MTNVRDLDLEARTKLEAALLARRKTAPAAQSIPRAGRDGPTALSPAQQRIWFGSEALTTGAGYNVVWAERLLGPVVVEALVRAFDGTVERHETLRSLIVPIDGIPKTQLCDERPRLAIVPVDAPKGAARDSLAPSLAGAVASRPFKLQEEAPLRATLYRFDDDDFLLVYVVHHIACDEWSIRLFNSEILAHYAANVAGVRPEAPELPVQYADFAAWQNSAPEMAQWDKSLGYWMSCLEGAPGDVTLPADKPQAPGGHGEAEECAFLLAPDISGAMDAIGRANGATPFMATLAATMAYLHLRTGLEDIAIATQIAARNRPELANLIGAFTNTIVMRTTSAGDPRFVDFMAVVRDQTIRSFSHQFLPFDVLMRKLRPHRGQGGIPFARLMFTHRHSFPSTFRGGSITSVPVQHPREKAKFDIWFSIIDDMDGRRVRLIYDSARYEAASVRALAADFRDFMEAAFARPEARLSSFASEARAPRGGVAASASVPTPPGDAASMGPAEPVSGTEARLAEIWSDVLKTEIPDVTASFFDLGGDSLLLMQMLHRIGEAFSVEPPMSDVFWEPNIRAIAKRIDALLQGATPTTAQIEQPDPLIVPLNQHSASASGRFFLISGAGGHVLPFAPMARRLAERWAGVGILDPSLAPEEPRLSSIQAIAARMVEGARKLDADGPYLLVGYSYGGLIAYEMARQFAALGATAGVVLLDTRFRSAHASRPIRRIARFAKAGLRRIRRHVAAVGNAGAPATPSSTLYSLETRQERARRESIGRGQRRAAQNYVPPASDTPLVVLRATDSIRPADTRDYGWAKIAPVLDVVETGGDHITLFKAANEAAFAEALDRALQRLSRGLVNGGAGSDGQ